MRTVHADFFGLSPSLQLTLGGSALLHAALLLGLPGPSSGTHGNAPLALQVQLAPANPAQAPTVPPRLSTAATAPLKSSTPIDTPAPSVDTPPPQPVAQASEAPPASSDAGYLPASQLDSPPRLLGVMQQVYPARARAAEVEGYVTLALLINERGEVEDVSVVKAQPSGYFEDAALSMLRKQRFTPPIKQNHAVKSRWLTTVRYRLQS